MSLAVLPRALMLAACLLAVVTAAAGSAVAPNTNHAAKAVNRPCIEVIQISQHQ